MWGTFVPRPGSETSAFSLSSLSRHLDARCLSGQRIVRVNGLKGFPKVINSAFSETVTRTGARQWGRMCGAFTGSLHLVFHPLKGVLACSPFGRSSSLICGSSNLWRIAKHGFRRPGRPISLDILQKCRLQTSNVTCFCFGHPTRLLRCIFED